MCVPIQLCVCMDGVRGRVQCLRPARVRAAHASPVWTMERAQRRRRRRRVTRRPHTGQAVAALTRLAGASSREGISGVKVSVHSHTRKHTSLTEPLVPHGSHTCADRCGYTWPGPRPEHNAIAGAILRPTFLRHARRWRARACICSAARRTYPNGPNTPSTHRTPRQAACAGKGGGAHTPQALILSFGAPQALIPCPTQGAATT